MTVSISYELSDLGRKESLRAGGDGKRVQTLTVNRGDPIYDLALNLASVDNDGRAILIVGLAFTLDGKPTYAISVQKPAYDTPQTAESLVYEENARRADTSERQRLNREAEAESTRKRIADWLALPLANRIGRPYSDWRPTWENDLLKDRPEYQEAKAECDRLNAEQKAADAREVAEKKAIKDAGEKALRGWSDTHGSDLLRARIEDGFEWLGLAEREYANSVVADLPAEAESPSEDVKALDRSTPTLEEINHLRHIRKALNGKPASAELKWMKYTIQDEDGYGETDRVEQAEIKVTVTCPTGREIDFYYTCPVAVEK